MTGARPSRTISDHGLIGDLRSAALIGSDGTIDWFCCPRFDSPSVFASLLDTDRGGSWELRPRDGEFQNVQFYLPDSNILITRFMTEAGVAEVHDFMPLLKADDGGHRQRLVRRVLCVRGTLTMSTRLAARPDYGLEQPTSTTVDGGVVISSDSISLGLSATTELTIDGADVTAEVELAEGDDVVFVLEVLDDGGEPRPCGQAEARELFEATNTFWRSWLAKSTYTGRWRETVNRSALTLKMLTHEPTGAIIAAPTTSLPEVLGGSRNWDYRYVWTRDAAFSLYACSISASPRSLPPSSAGCPSGWAITRPRAAAATSARSGCCTTSTATCRPTSAYSNISRVMPARNRSGSATRRAGSCNSTSTAS